MGWVCGSFLFQKELSICPFLVKFDRFSEADTNVNDLHTKYDKGNKFSFPFTQTGQAEYYTNSEWDMYNNNNIMGHHCFYY